MLKKILAPLLIKHALLRIIIYVKSVIALIILHTTSAAVIRSNGIQLKQEPRVQDIHSNELVLDILKDQEYHVITISPPSSQTKIYDRCQVMEGTNTLH